MAECPSPVNCKMEYRIQRLEEDQRTHDEQNQKTHKEFHNKFGDVQTVLAEQKVHNEYMKNTQKEILIELKNISNAPKKHWNHVITVLITAIITGVISTVIAVINNAGG